MNQKGQSLVEYLLLVAISALLVSLFMNNQNFKDFLSPQGKVFSVIKNSQIFSYRHAYLKIDAQDNSNIQGGFHHSFLNDQGESRFFSPLSPYPGP